MEKPNHSKGKIGSVVPHFYGADTGRSRVFTEAHRISTGATLSPVIVFALSQGQVMQTKAR
jgi:hypothetical protein